MSVKFNSKSLIFGIATTAALAGIGGYVWHEEHRPAVLEIFIFALKSGSSVFVRTPDDKRILIDGGANADVIRELTRILPFYSRRIDTIIATNSDAKNITGLIDVASRYTVDNAYVPAYTTESLGLASSTDQIYKTLLDTLESKKISVHEVKAGDFITLGKDIQANVLFPVPPNEFDYSKVSAPELFMQISYGTTEVALLGDASKKVQKFIASSSPGVADVLFVSQGVAPEDVSLELIEGMNPKYLVYSKAVNKPGNPPTMPSPKKTAKGLLKIPAKSNTKSSTKKTASRLSKKEIIDPLDSIAVENRFNLKEKGTVHFVSDGSTIMVK